MKCPYCNTHRNTVKDTRSSGAGCAIRRRRRCLSCGRRFTTYERIAESILYVIKKDGRREPYNRLKILEGLQRACEKRPISRSDIEDIVNKIELELYEHFDREVTSNHVGELVMQELKAVDQVAYVRFASVYREFKDGTQFSQLATELGSMNANRAASSTRDTSGQSSPSQGRAAPRAPLLHATRADFRRLMKLCTLVPLDKAIRQFPMFERHKIEGLYQALAAEPHLRDRVANCRKWFTTTPKSIRPATGSVATADDMSPSQHNAIKVLEESCGDA